MECLYVWLSFLLILLVKRLNCRSLGEVQEGQELKRQPQHMGQDRLQAGPTTMGKGSIFIRDVSSGCQSLRSQEILSPGCEAGGLKEEKRLRYRDPGKVVFFFKE